MERKIVPFHSRSVAILSAARRPWQFANTLLRTHPVKEKIITAFICVANPITIAGEIEAPIMVTTCECGMMTMGRLTNKKTWTDFCFLRPWKMCDSTAHFCYLPLIFRGNPSCSTNTLSSPSNKAPKCCLHGKDQWRKGRTKHRRNQQD